MERASSVESKKSNSTQIDVQMDPKSIKNQINIDFKTGPPWTGHLVYRPIFMDHEEEMAAVAPSFHHNHCHRPNSSSLPLPMLPIANTTTRSPVSIDRHPHLRRFDQPSFSARCLHHEPHPAAANIITGLRHSRDVAKLADVPPHSPLHLEMSRAFILPVPTTATSLPITTASHHLRRCYCRHHCRSSPIIFSNTTFPS